MAKFADIAAGTSARRPITLDIQGTKVALDVRVLSPAEEADVTAQAYVFAKGRGIEDPQDDHELVSYGRWVHTALLGCVDAASPPGKEEPFFESVDQILNNKKITRAHVAYLHAQQELWQDENSPYDKSVPAAEMILRCKKIAGGDLDPFVCLPPAMQWAFTRSMAAMLVALLADKSRSGAPSSDSSTTHATETEEASAEPTSGYPAEPTITYED